MVKNFFIFLLWVAAFNSFAKAETFRSAQQIEDFSQRKDKELEIEKSLTKKKNFKIQTEKSEELHEKEDLEDAKYKKWINSIPVFELKEIEFLGLVDYKKEDLKQFYQEHIGKKVDGYILASIANKISKFYLKHDYLLTHPYIAYKQDFKDGVAKIQIVNGGIKTVTIIGDKRKNNLLEQYRQKLINMERPIKSSQVLRYLKLIDNIPGLSVEFVRLQLVPDDTRQNFVDLAKIIILVKEEKQNMSLKISNNVNTDYGNYRVRASTTYYNPFKRGDVVRVHLSTSDKFTTYKNIAVNYAFPINDKGTKASIFLSALRAKKYTPKEEKQITPSNTFNAAVTLSHAWIVKRRLSVEPYITVDFAKDQNNNLQGKYASSTTYSARIGANVEFYDKFKGRNYIVAEVEKGLPNSSYKFFKGATPYHMDKNYTKFDFQYYRIDKFNKKSGLSSKVFAQYSPDVLPRNDRISFGGQLLVRGYRDDYISASSGVGFSVEPYYYYRPQFFYVKLARLFCFFDYGKIMPNKKDLFSLSGRKEKVISSLGIGTDFYLADSLKLDVRYAKRLNKSVVEVAKGKKKKAGELTFSLSHDVQW